MVGAVLAGQGGRLNVDGKAVTEIYWDFKRPSKPGKPATQHKKKSQKKQFRHQSAGF